jgi:AraC family transcriptional regulator of adaptative response/methylated-DNA-[protein]-cysteine methyltransferase
MNPSSDYRTVADAIRFLREHHRAQPDLETVASAVGLSPFHFQRLFTRWAGVSPKRFLQFLTLDEARDRLRASEPVLEAAWSTGLSGAGRLHDLFVATIGTTPGEYKTGGQDLVIQFGLVETPFGTALLGFTHRGICHLAFLDDEDTDGRQAYSALRDAWPLSDLRENPGEARRLVQAIFARPLSFPGGLSLHLKGTNFQLQVWEALLRIPPGAVTSYGRLARAMHRPGAARAVGSAVAMNPVAWLIPCHRVIREAGGLGGYRWGPIRKQTILAWEGAQKSFSNSEDE